MYSALIRSQAEKLRKRGSSLREVSEKLKISKSTASEWLSFLELSSSVQNRLANKQIMGRYKAIINKRKLKAKQKEILEKKAYELLKSTNLSKELIKLCCALLWWCEGNKDDSMVRFTSSDITLIKNFLSLLRSGFEIDESKFRALVHLHSYHDEVAQKKFWSIVTNIPLSQFYRSYQKLNAGKRLHKDYPGCIAISYYDAKIAKELYALYNAFGKIRGVR